MTFTQQLIAQAALCTGWSLLVLFAFMFGTSLRAEWRKRNWIAAGINIVMLQFIAWAAVFLVIINIKVWA